MKKNEMKQKQNEGKTKIQHVFLIGAKGLGAYGGYETFVNKLTEYHQDNKNIQYHVACKANGEGCMNEEQMEGVNRISDSEFTYQNARCFKIKIPNIGSAQAIYYDVVALKSCCKYIKLQKIINPIIYILACRIGPFLPFYYRKIHNLGGKIYLNPDGHEWMRDKWSTLVRKYWKVSEKIMVKNCDLVICDSLNIEEYIHKSYDGKGIRGTDPKTVFIPYGAESRKSLIDDNDKKLLNWYKEKGLSIKEYYLVVGRFVPENNYEIMIAEFMKSKTNKNLTIITNANDKLLNELEKKLCFKSDGRIKFVGTVYDLELLMKIRENAYGYIHGHEVGGTNPSLLEALGSTNINLLLDVGFNREVAEESSFYWDKAEGTLRKLIHDVDILEEHVISLMGKNAKKRIEKHYQWIDIVKKYEILFCK